jgi:dihydropteroate synthase
MKKYYTRVCNFAYGKSSINLVNKKKNIPLNGNKELSFGQIEIITRDSKKIIDLKDIKRLPKLLREKIGKDLKIIKKKNRNFSNLNFKKIPNIMGVLNLTPDSFSDGGKFNKKKSGIKHAINLFKFGADIVDVGGESTRPGSKPVSEKREWKRIEKIIKEINEKIPLSLDTRKADIMSKGVKI